MKLISLSWIITKLVRKKKRLRKKKRTSIQKGRWLIHHLQNISHQKVYTFWYCFINDELPSTSSKIVKQIEVIQGVVLSGISKMNDSAPGKKRKNKHYFLQKKPLVRGNWFWYCLLYLLSHQLMDRVIE